MFAFMNVTNPPTSLAQQVNDLACSCCKKMTRSERKQFFDWQENFRATNPLALKKKYYAGKRYYKGKRKGQLRDIYEVDGFLFEQLWKLLQPYAITSVRNSFYSNCDEETVKDNVGDIRFMTFWALRYFGPTPNDTSFFNYFPLVVNNILTYNAVWDRGEPTRKDRELSMAGNKKAALKIQLRRNFMQPLSISTPVDREHEEEAEIADTIPDETYANFEFWSGVPEDMREIVQSILVAGVRDTSKRFKMNPQTLKSVVATRLQLRA